MMGRGKELSQDLCNKTVVLHNCSCKHHWGHYPHVEGTSLWHRLTRLGSSMQDFWSGSQKVNQKSNPRAKHHSERAPERILFTRQLHREKNRQCSPPPPPPCTLTQEDTVNTFKLVWSLQHNIWKSLWITGKLCCGQMSWQ